MSYNLTFGKHQGHSLEWLFFNDLPYLRWMMRDVIFQPQRFPSYAMAHLQKLINRAERLAPPCMTCHSAPAIYMAEKRMDFVFHCRQCGRFDWEGATNTWPPKPSFRITDDNSDGADDAAIVAAIKAAFFRNELAILSDSEAIAFFEDDRNFALSG